MRLKTNVLKKWKLDEATVETCPDGLPHQFSYQGSESQHYRCNRCLSRVTKESLKEVSDNA